MPLMSYFPGVILNWVGIQIDSIDRDFLVRLFTFPMLM